MIDLNDYEECKDCYALVRTSAMNAHDLWWHERVNLFMDAVQNGTGGF